MVKIFEKYKKEIEGYCTENSLLADRVFSSACSYNDTRVVLQHPELNTVESAKGLADNVPAKVTLFIFLENGKLRFEQTEHTRRYLGVEDEAKRRVA
ncbi:hypothetical protein R80B4_00422 [Fibrobacteres bacterium R8-0-B4]